MKKLVLQLTAMGLIKMVLVGIELKLIILTNRFDILIEKITINMFLRVIE